MQNDLLQQIFGLTPFTSFMQNNHLSEWKLNECTNIVYFIYEFICNELKKYLEKLEIDIHFSCTN